MRIGPTYCGECGNDYGHYDHCSKSTTRPENWPLSRKLQELATSATPDNERLQVLISLSAELAAKVEKL